MKKLCTFACAIALSTLAACGGGGSGTPAASAPPAQPPGPTITLSISADLPETRVGGYPIVLSPSIEPANSSANYQWSLETGSPGTLSAGPDGKATYRPPASSSLLATAKVTVRLASGSASKTISFNLYPAFADGALRTLAAPGGGTFAELSDAIAMADGSALVLDRRKKTLYGVMASGDITAYLGMLDAPNAIWDPTAIAVSPAGSVHVFDYGSTVKKVSYAGEVTLVKAIPVLFDNDQLNGIGPMVFGQDGSIYLSDWYTIRRIAPDGTLSTLAGACDAIGAHDGDIVCGDNKHLDGTGAQARFMRPRGMAVAADGSLLVAEGSALRKVTMQGVVTTVFDGPAVDVRLDGEGNVIFVGNNAVRRLNADGSATTLAAALGPAGNLLRQAVPLAGKRLLLVYADSLQVLQLP